MVSYLLILLKILQFYLDDEAYDFVGEFKPMNSMLDFEKPATHGVQTEEDWHFEHKARQHNDLMTKAFPKIEQISEEF